MKPRYVYFNKKTGVITDILSNKKRGKALYVITDEATVGPIIAGIKGMLDLVVAYDYNQKKYVLLERDNIIKLRYYGKELYKIPNREIPDYDLRIDLFAGGNALEISLDPSRISTMYSTVFRQDVQFEKGTELRIYIKDKDGNILLKTIIIDAQKLLENGQLFFELKDIDTSSNLSFYTNRVFDNYMWTHSKKKFLSPMRDMLRFEVQKADLKIRSPKFEYHLYIKEDVNGIKIKNNIDNVKLLKIFNDIEFFIVGRYDPAILYEKFVLKPEAFKLKNIYVKTKEDMKGKTILYNHKHISVLIEG